MAHEVPVLMRSYPAGAGGLASSQYKFCKIVAGLAVVCDAATDVPRGVLQNTPAEGENAQLMVLGISKVASDEALTIDWLIGTSSDGQADRKIPGTDTTEYVVGRVEEGTTAAGGLASAFINCLSPHRAS